MTSTFVSANLFVALTLAFTEAISTASTTIRVCQGSSCLGKCRGAFNPMDSFRQIKEANDSSIDLEETLCLNMCKKGPNARIIVEGEALTFHNVMSEMEIKRKAFQGISSDQRVDHVWGIALGVDEGDIIATSGVSVDKMNDIMPS